jgi:hypothetical protein
MKGAAGLEGPPRLQAAYDALSDDERPRRLSPTPNERAP